MSVIYARYKTQQWSAKQRHGAPPTLCLSNYHSILAFPKSSCILLLIFFVLHNNLVRDIHNSILWMKNRDL